MKLNIGSGKFPKAGYTNVDILPEADVVHNLDKFPYPFADNSIELLEADHVLEHLSDPFAAMRELHRILAPNGVLKIRVPHFSRGFTHSDHKRGFDVAFPFYFNPANDDFVGVPFRLTALRLTWFAQPYRARKVLPRPAYYAGRFLDAIFTPLANLSPFLCSRLWCFWVGGFEEISYEFRKS